MAKQNMLREERPRGGIDNPVAYINLTTEKRTRIHHPDGTEKTIIAARVFSRPDGRGGYQDIEEALFEFDPAGNPLLPEMGRLVRSHSGSVFIPNGVNHGLCAWPGHRGPNRHVLLGQDGVKLEDGTAICDPCRQKRNLIRFIGFTLGGSALLGVVIGLFIGAWGG